MDLRVPAGRRQADPLDRPVPGPGAPCALQRQGARRAARLLGSGLPHEDRRGPRDHHALPGHADAPRHVPRRLRGAVRPGPRGHALADQGRHGGRVRQVDGRAEGAPRDPRRRWRGRRGRRGTRDRRQEALRRGQRHRDRLRRLPHARGCRDELADGTCA